MIISSNIDRAKVVVKIIGKDAYNAESVGDAIVGLPEKHAFAQIWDAGACGAKLPMVESLGKIKLKHQRAPYGLPRVGIKAGSLKVGDSCEVLYPGTRQDSGGGTFHVISKRAMTVIALIDVDTVRSGDAGDSSDFVSAGDALYAVLDDGQDSPL